MDSGTRRVTESRLIDHDGLVREGDFLLHGRWVLSVSNGDEDVVEIIDGSDLLITRSSKIGIHTSQ